ncbi:MAG: DUF302 domain-containing protein [bacterium]
MENIGGYANRIETQLSHEDAVTKVTEFLSEEGFGVLTEIDVRATLKKKLDVDYKPFKILGACNPPFAHKALEAENLVSVLLPCNVVVIDEGDYRVIAAMDPHVMLKMIDKPEMVELAHETGEKLARVLARVEVGD